MSGEGFTSTQRVLVLFGTVMFLLGTIVFLSNTDRRRGELVAMATAGDQSTGNAGPAILQRIERMEASHAARDEELKVQLAKLSAKVDAVARAPPPAKVGAPSCRFVIDPCSQLPDKEAAQNFGSIYENAVWGNAEASLGSHTRSGHGSTLKGAFDWIAGLGKFFLQNPNVTAIADIPSGDVGWQMALPRLNNAKLYFGGDIAEKVAHANARRFADHNNKLFRHWDLHACGVPRWRSTCDKASAPSRPFDMIIVRDALQHIHIDKVLTILRKVVLQSGVRYFATSSYDPSLVAGCTTEAAFQCTHGKIVEGNWYPISMDCQPFSLPQPIFKARSHETFPMENDWLHIYEVNDELRSAVERMPERCQS